MNALARFSLFKHGLCRTWRGLGLGALALLAVAGCASHGGDAPPAPVLSEPVAAELPAHVDEAGFEPWLQAQRARIDQARDAAQQRFAVAEKQCWRRFAVNDCLRRARAERRASLDALQQETLALNALERQRRTAQRLQQIERKSSAP